MKRILTSALLFTAISSAGQTGTEEVHLPVIRYNPAPVCLLIRSSIPVRYLSVQEAFIVSLKDGDTEIAPKCIGIKDKEQGNLKYLCGSILTILSLHK